MRLLILLMPFLFFITSCKKKGCTNLTATNYDADAKKDDGTCVFNEGCTNPAAINYDVDATKDNGTCILESFAPFGEVGNTWTYKKIRIIDSDTTILDTVVTEIIRYKGDNLYEVNDNGNEREWYISKDSFNFFDNFYLAEVGEPYYGNLDYIDFGETREVLNEQVYCKLIMLRHPSETTSHTYINEDYGIVYKTIPYYLTTRNEWMGWDYTSYILIEKNF